MGCTGTSKKEVLHPLPERLPEISSSFSILEIAQKSQAVHEILNTEPNYIIGKSNDFEERFFSEPSKIFRDNDSRIFIMDERNNNIRVYNKDGTINHKIGNTGRGPGEFEHIISFILNENQDELYALDRFEIEVFKKDNDQKFYPVKSINHQYIRAFDICLIDKSIYISGYKYSKAGKEAVEEGTTHRIVAPTVKPIGKFDLSNEVFNKYFGFNYRSNSGYGTFDGILSRTILACNNYTNTVVAFSSNFSYLIGYNKEGEEKWRTKLEGYIDVNLLENNDGKNNTFALYEYANSDLYNIKYPIISNYLENQKEYIYFQLGFRKPQKYFKGNNISSIPSDSIISLKINAQTGVITPFNASKVVGLLSEDLIISTVADFSKAQSFYNVYYNE